LGHRAPRIEELEPRALLCATSAVGAVPILENVEDSAPVGALVRAAAPTVRIVATDATAAETMAGQPADTGTFTVRRSGAVSRSLRVHFHVVGTATNGVDYSSLATSILIRSGRSSATIRVTPRDDAAREAAEHATLTLTASTAYAVDATAATATVTIADNDTPNPAIAALVNEVQDTNGTAQVDSYEEFLSLLPVNQGDRRGYSGVTPQPGLIATRDAISSALAQSLSPAGGTVSFQDFRVGGFAGRNIVGVLPGQGPRSSQQFVITAHYDSVENGGADDNGSGVAGLLTAAQVLAHHRFDATVVFVATDQEEERANGWGVGSQYFAQTARANAANIRGTIVLDMIAYNHEGGNRAVVGQSDRGVTPSTALVGEIHQAFQLYTNIATTRETGIDETDALRFRQAGFTVATLIEQLDTDGSLLNPNYHDGDDYYRDASGRLQQFNGRPYLDLAYATQMTRGTVAWVAAAAGLLDGSRSAVASVTGAPRVAGGEPIDGPVFARTTDSPRPVANPRPFATPNALATLRPYATPGPRSASEGAGVIPALSPLVASSPWNQAGWSRARTTNLAQAPGRELDSFAVFDAVFAETRE
jgi:hypothetical protein